MAILAMTATGGTPVPLRPNYLVIAAFSARKPYRLLSITAQLLHFRVEKPLLSLYILSPLLCFHTHSRFDLHF
jgi:hypothetical protein